MRFGNHNIPRLYYVLAIGYLLFCLLFTPNFLITLPIVIFPLLIYRLFWIDNQPNVIFWGMLLQWTLPAAQLIYSNFLGITLAEKMRGSPLYSNTMEYATLLCVMGIFSFSFGLFFAVKNIRFNKSDNSVFEYSPRRILILYVSFTAIMVLTKNLIWLFPGFVQFIFIFFYIKWGLFLVTFYIINKRAPLLRLNFYAFILFELVLGLSSFFAGEIILTVVFTGVAVVHLKPKLSVRTTIFAVIVLMLLANYLILWSAIKTEYRAYVTKGQVTQAVQVSSEEARAKLIDLFFTVDEKDYQTGIESFVNRVGYIHFFAATLNYVPKVVPHQDGEVYWSAVQHFIIPRFLNPDKKILDDSEHTTRYTGIKLSGRKEGSSFSLGYIPDAYIDYGPVWMHVLLAATGFLFGFCYRFIVERCPNQFWAWILTGPFVIILNINGADTKKALGGLILYFVTILVVRKPLIRFIESYLRPQEIS